jgi:hypothetical protein
MAAACTEAELAEMAEACTEAAMAAKAGMAEAYTEAAMAAMAVEAAMAGACTEAEMAAKAGMAEAYTEAAMAAKMEENTWDALEPAREAEASCAGPGRWAAPAVASAEPAVRQEWPPPDGLVRCMKLRARACWLASPD